MEKRSPYRIPAEREPGPSLWELIMHMMKINWKRILAFGVGIYFIAFSITKITSCVEKSNIEAKALKLEQVNHLQEMKKVCAPDHFQLEQKIGDELWQVSCMPDSGKVRLLYIEHK